MEETNIQTNEEIIASDLNLSAPVFVSKYDPSTPLREEEKRREKLTKDQKKRELVTGLNIATSKILAQFKKKTIGFDIDTMADVFFSNFVDMATDEDIKKEIAFLRNKFNLILQQIKEK